MIAPLALTHAAALGHVVPQAPPATLQAHIAHTAKTMMIAKQSGMFTNQEVLQIFNYVELASNALQQGQSTDANFYISLQTLSGLKT